MSLVAYDYGSASEEDEEEQEENNPCKREKDTIGNVTKSHSPVNIDNTETKGEKNTVGDVEDSSSPVAVSSTSHGKTNLFLTLPETKTPFQDETEDQIEDFVPKSKPAKEKQKVKITIPSLSQFENDSDEEPEMKKFRTLKSSGLISLLPPVKGTVKTTKSFIPNVIARNIKATPNKDKKKSVPQKLEKKKQLPPKPRRQSVSDAESEDDIAVPDTFDDEMWEKVCGRQKSKPVIREPENRLSEEILDIAPEPETPYEGLDNQAFKELIGKTKRPVGNIKLIDINEEEILPDKDLWMTKSLTDPELAPKPTVDDPVDPTRRKKHHITYLAQQAKANEQELQNAWSASKNNRLASRAKYGF